MSDWNEYKMRQAREDARIANFPYTVQHVAHVLLTNRALAATLLHLDTDVKHYADICNFLDHRVQLLVEKAMAVNIPEPPQSDDGPEHLSEDDEPKSLSSEERRICVGLTQKGKPCTTRARYEHAGTPYCAVHYPYSEGYRAFRAQEEKRNQEYSAKYREYLEEREALLNYIETVEKLIWGLDQMNNTLTRAVQRLELRAPKVVKSKAFLGPRELVRVDGLNFYLEGASYPESFWIVGNDDDRLAVCVQQRDDGWAVFELDRNTGGFRNSYDYFLARRREEAIRYAVLYTMCYHIRYKRDLEWFTETIATLSQQGVDITSRVPLQDLCNITITSHGWHVFQRARGENHRKFVALYTGESEIEARWEYTVAEREGEIAIVLVSPSNQIVDYRVHTQELW